MVELPLSSLRATLNGNLHHTVYLPIAYVLTFDLSQIRCRIQAFDRAFSGVREHAKHDRYLCVHAVMFLMSSRYVKKHCIQLVTASIQFHVRQ